MSQLKLAIVPRKIMSCTVCLDLENIETCAGSVVLEAVLLRSHEVATLVLSHSDVPGPTG